MIRASILAAALSEDLALVRTARPASRDRWDIRTQNLSHWCATITKSLDKHSDVT